MRLESLDFTGVLEGYRRNEESPTKGIDTHDKYDSIRHCAGRNEESPTKGIDTYILKLALKYPDESRNEESPTKGIDT